MSNFTKTKCFNSGRISIAFKVNLDTGEIYWQYAKRNKKDKNDPQFGMYLAKERLKKNPTVVKNFVEAYLNNCLFCDIIYNGYRIFFHTGDNLISYEKEIFGLPINIVSNNYRNYSRMIEEDEILEFHL